jgi:tetratricopeptide (TPR) repeat protein
MDLRSAVRASLEGRLSLDQLRDWIEEHRSRYRKPPRPSMDVPIGDLDRWINDFSDWEIRMHELARQAEALGRAALDGLKGGPAVQSAQILYALTHIIDDVGARAKAAFALGYALWKNNEFFDATKPLEEAERLFRQQQESSLREIEAKSYLSDCLRQDCRYDQAIRCAEELKARSIELGFDGHAASAFRDLGMSQASLGREQEALAALREAVERRRHLPLQVAKEQGVVSLAAFRNDFGITARRFGYFDEAIRMFTENAESEERDSNPELAALALSEIGYTYFAAGDTARAQQYLELAVARAERHGEPTANSRRWRAQIDSLLAEASFPSDGSSQADDDAPLDAEIPAAATAESAYQMAEEAHTAARLGKYKRALALASKALQWAAANSVADLRVTCLNVIGICNDRMGQRRDAISAFQRGIQLADTGGGGSAASLMLRQNLAKVFLRERRAGDAVDVLLAGFGATQQALARADSFAVRQRIVSGALALYELYALILSANDDAANNEEMLAMTETVRARNMAAWASAQEAFEDHPSSSADGERVGRDLLALRAVEVELELRHVVGSLSSERADALFERTRELQRTLDQTAKRQGVAYASGTTAADLSRQAIDKTLTEDTAILSLFAIPEGVCGHVFARQNGELSSAGTLIRWERDDRLKTLTRWTGRTAWLRGRAMRGARGTSDPADFDLLRQTIGTRLFEPLVPIVRRFPRARLAIIPHRELALLPFWDLVDACPGIDAFTLTPSLTLLRICAARVRSQRGPAVSIPDVTKTLPFTALELERIRVAREGDVTDATSVDQFLQQAPQCSLLHVAGHGVFNHANPYYSGVLVGASDSTTGLLVQYAHPVTKADDVSFEFSDTPAMGSFRLLTVAECMARASLDACLLAVLSACECGLADHGGGGELTSLPTSLLVAGAKSVIAPLWPVDDAATAVLMSLFYRTWDGGAGKQPSPAAALKTARRQLQAMTRTEIADLLAGHADLPDGDHPFAHGIDADAFACFGAF